MSEPCEFSFELAPFILGELQEEDARSVREHIVGCDVCSHDLEEFCETISLLESGSPNRRQDVSLATVRSTKTRARTEDLLLDRRKSTRWLVGSLVAAVAALLGFVGGNTYSNLSSNSMDLLRGSQNVGYSTVVFQSKSWGTEMRFTLSKIPKVAEIGAWVKLEDGTRSTVCWWPLAPHETSGTFVASTPLSYAQIKSIGIITKNSHSLWWLPIRSTPKQ